MRAILILSMGLLMTRGELADGVVNGSNLVSIRKKLADGKEDHFALYDRCRFRSVIKSGGKEVAIEGLRVSNGLGVAVVFSGLDDSSVEIDEESIRRACKNLEVLLRKKQGEANMSVQLRSAIRELGEQESRSKK